MARGLFIASTGQHIGKTTTCLGLFSALQRRLGRVGFIKPVGQEHLEVAEGISVDKDVILFKEYFGIDDDYQSMSPVLFPRGFTRDFLDGKLDSRKLERTIRVSFKRLSETSDCVLVEGTGHVGVGSIAKLNNAHVAQLLRTPVVLIVSGGLGSAFDSLALNKSLCDQHRVPVAGVILNRVIPEKRDMVLEYMNKALARWDVPLLGAIPYDDLLATPCLGDFETLFDAPILTGERHRYRHFDHIRLVATTHEVYEQTMEPRQLTITPASRVDIISSTLAKLKESKKNPEVGPYEPGVILTGRFSPKPKTVRQLAAADVPMLYSPLNSFSVMRMISSHTAKIRTADTLKVNRATEIVEAHVDIDLVIRQTGVVRRRRTARPV